jgi:class 3 adenylate cyclase
VSLTLLVFPLFMHHSTETVPFVPFVFLAGAGGLTGALGALVAQKRKPREVNPAEEETAAASHGPMNRAALLDQMFALQRQLTEQKRRAAFLSVDVVGSSAIKQAALTTGDELAVEHAFVQYHRWVEQVVCAHGGRVHATAGDGVMCLFDDIGGPFNASPETRAVRAARDLQTRLATFNEAQQACLSAPLRIRCGVSAGEVAIEPGVPVGHLQSAVIDRAATLQKRAAPGDIVVDHETAVTALTELGAWPLCHPLRGPPPSAPFRGKPPLLRGQAQRDRPGALSLRSLHRPASIWRRGCLCPPERWSLQVDWQEDQNVLKAAYRSEQNATVKARLHLLWLVRQDHRVSQTAQLTGWLPASRSGPAQSCKKRPNQRQMALRVRGK